VVCDLASHVAERSFSAGVRRERLVADAIVRIRSGRMTKAIVSRSHVYVSTPFLGTTAAFELLV
jgi:hypothetical protein